MLLENLHFENQLRHSCGSTFATCSDCLAIPCCSPFMWAFAKRKARGLDWVQSARRSIGPSRDRGLDALRQLDRLALQLPQGRLLHTRLTKPKNVKYESCCHKTTEMSEAIASWADSVAFERREENVSCPCFEYRGYIQV